MRVAAGRDSACGGLQKAAFRIARPSPRRRPAAIAGSSRGSKPGLHQRRLAAARWPVDQPDGKRLVGVALLDLCLPKANAFGQAVAVARAGEQLEEEVGIVGIERPQTFGNDLNSSRSEDAANGGVERAQNRRAACSSRNSALKSGLRRSATRRAAALSSPGCPLPLAGRQPTAQIVGHVLGGRVALRRPFRSALRQIRSSSFGIASSIAAAAGRRASRFAPSIPASSRPGTAAGRSSNS